MPQLQCESLEKNGQIRTLPPSSLTFVRKLLDELLCKCLTSLASRGGNPE